MLLGFGVSGTCVPGMVVEVGIWLDAHALVPVPCYCCRAVDQGAVEVE